MTGETIDVTVHCRECHENTTIRNIPLKGYMDWLDGELIQKALPEIDYKLRELLISATCPTCWDKMFKCMEEEDEDQEK